MDVWTHGRNCVPDLTAENVTGAHRSYSAIQRCSYQEYRLAPGDVVKDKFNKSSFYNLSVAIYQYGNLYCKFSKFAKRARSVPAITGSPN